MPPQARSISSYFKPTGVAAATSSTTATAAGAGAGLTTPEKKKGILSEAAKRAIEEGLSAAKQDDEEPEPSKKKQKVDPSPSTSSMPHFPSSPITREPC